MFLSSIVTMFGRQNDDEIHCSEWHFVHQYNIRKQPTDNICEACVPTVFHSWQLCKCSAGRIFHIINKQCVLQENLVNFRPTFLISRLPSRIFMCSTEKNLKKAIEMNKKTLPINLPCRTIAYAFKHRANDNNTLLIDGGPKSF